MEYLSSDILETYKSQVISDIETHAEWREEICHGKMFGFLVCRDAHGEEVLLKAYSGQIQGRSDWQGYVPAIFDYLQPDGYFKVHEAEITAINREVEAEKTMLAGKRSARLDALKAERKQRSNALQRWLFSQFMLAGPQGKSTSVLQVFTDYAQANGLKQQYPPGGTGECCAPKLLHYANSHGLEPRAIAEFWYGDSPRGEVRHHGRFYEPCQAKCVPILWYLWPEMAQQQTDDDGRPMADALDESSVIYEDEWLIAIDKPAGLLSVPGKRQMRNAESLLREMIARRGDGTVADEVRMVHRLDMDTSGVLLAAKTEEVYKAMQRMFAVHEEVEKEYVAVVSAAGASQMDVPPSGIISLPLSADFLNRPRQVVDYEHGKEAVTRYVMEAGDGLHRCVHLFPQTGRTHQLRMHCAHADGLGMPILGDPLYGIESADRMYLHACRLAFRHPVTGERVEISRDLLSTEISCSGRSELAMLLPSSRLKEASFG